MLTSLLAILYVISVAVWMGVLFYRAARATDWSGAGSAIAIILMAWIWPIAWVAIAVFHMISRADAAIVGDDDAA